MSRQPLDIDVHIRKNRPCQQPRERATMVTITTTYKVNDKGAGRVTAKGGGKQRTVTYDHSRTPEQNHGDAAGTLGLVLGFGPDAADVCQHVNNGDGSHTFRFLF